MDGRMSFFCFEAGRISSRSTGTPRETRKSLRMRDRIQFAGWRGGGATSCDQSEALRGVRKMGFSACTGGSTEESMVSGGKRVSRYGSVAAAMSSVELRAAKSRTGYGIGQSKVTICIGLCILLLTIENVGGVGCGGGVGSAS